MKRIVIIGANEFQNPLILKAKEMGLETHVFAWRDGAVGEKNADFFYPVSIVEKEMILKKCLEINPDAVATIGSDLAMITVQYLASELQLPCNSDRSIIASTNKYFMRQAFEAAGVNVPAYMCVDAETGMAWENRFNFPVIVKPTDRSGSRGVMKVYEYEKLKDAIEKAINVSFEGKAIIEEYIDGAEYSFECISDNGVHRRLAITQKYTTGSPNYIEIGHIEPSGLPEEVCGMAEETIFQALDALEIRNGASHAEFKVDADGKIHIIEIGARMGGDCIGSDLVRLSTGYDFVKMVIQAALGEPIDFSRKGDEGVAAIRFIMCRKDFENFQWIQKEFPEKIVSVSDIQQCFDKEIVDSGSRYGYYILKCSTLKEAESLAKLEIREEK